MRKKKIYILNFSIFIILWVGACQTSKQELNIDNVSVVVTETVTIVNTVIPTIIENIITTNELNTDSMSLYAMSLEKKYYDDILEKSKQKKISILESYAIIKIVEIQNKLNDNPKLAKELYTKLLQEIENNDNYKILFKSNIYDLILDELDADIEFFLLNYENSANKYLNIINKYTNTNIDKIYTKLFNALIEYKDARTVYSFYLENKNFFDKTYFNDKILFKLMSSLFNDNLNDYAHNIARNILIDFPSGEYVMKTWTYLNQKYNSSYIINFIMNINNKNKKITLFKKIMREKSYNKEMRNIAFDLINIEEKKINQNKLIILSNDDIDKYTEQAELLLSTREYILTNKLLEIIIKSEIFKINNKQNDVLLLYARSFNFIDKYTEAAKSYKEIIEKNNTQNNENILLKYLTSLHYAGLYEEELKLTTVKNFDKLWITYLAKKYDNYITDAENLLTSKKITTAEKQKIMYWLARSYENKNNLIEANKIYNLIINNHGYSIYALYAKFRIEKSEQITNNIINNEDFLEPEKQNFKYSELATAYYLGIMGKGEYSKNILQKYNTLHANNFNIWIETMKVAGLNRELVNLGLKKINKYLEQGNLLENNISNYKIYFNLAWPTPYLNIIKHFSNKYNLPENLLLSIMRAESMFNPYAESYVGALGLMQIMPQTGYRIAEIAKDNNFSKNLLLNPSVAISYAAWYLNRLNTYYNNCLICTIAAYNAGPDAVNRWIKQNKTFALDEFTENIAYDQTKFYVKKVLLSMHMYYAIYINKNEKFLLNLSIPLPEPKYEMEIF